VLTRRHKLLAASKGASGPTYQQMILADGPAAYWPLDESAAPLKDRIGTRHCTVVGPVALNQSGVVAGNKSVLIPINGQVLPPGAFPGLGSVFTLEIWYKLPATNISTAVLLSQNILTDGDFQWRIGATNGPPVMQYFHNTHQTFSWPTSLTLGLWHHLVITGATRMLFYTNGVQVADNPLSAAGAGPGPGGIGCAQDTATVGAQGFMQDVAIYQKVLTPAQILAHYKNRVP
jgi:hypothetical protein